MFNENKKNPLGDTGFEKASDFRDDSCQNLKVDLLKLINDSAVVEGIDKEWTDGKKEFDLYEMINEKIAELQEIEQEIQPEYMTIDALKSIVDVTCCHLFFHKKINPFKSMSGNWLITDFCIAQKRVIAVEFGLHMPLKAEKSTIT